MSAEDYSKHTTEYLQDFVQTLDDNIEAQRVAQSRFPNRWLKIRADILAELTRRKSCGATLSDFPRLTLGDEFTGPDGVTYMKVSFTQYAPVVDDAPIPLGGELTPLATAARYCSDNSKWIEFQQNKGD